MQPTEPTQSLHDKIVENYNASLKIIHELKEQRLDGKKE